MGDPIRTRFEPWKPREKKEKRRRRRLMGDRRLRDQIGLIIVKHLGSKNPSYPDDSYTAGKFIALADEIAWRIAHNEF